MKYEFNSREELEAFIQNEVLTTSEALEVLERSRQRLNDLVKAGKIKPLKSVSRDRLYLRKDIEKMKKELDETRKKYRPYDE